MNLLLRRLKALAGSWMAAGAQLERSWSGSGAALQLLLELQLHQPRPAFMLYSSARVGAWFLPRGGSRLLPGSLPVRIELFPLNQVTG